MRYCKIINKDPFNRSNVLCSGVSKDLKMLTTTTVRLIIFVLPRYLVCQGGNKFLGYLSGSFFKCEPGKEAG